MIMCGTEATFVAKHSPISSTTANTISHHTTQNAATGQNLDYSKVINLDHGDPAMYESYWRKMGKSCAITFAGDEHLSYFSDVNKVCWFMEPKLEEEIRRLHTVVGNAAVDNHDDYIVVGNGSSQLIQAALYALSSHHSDHHPRPISVVCAAPYYSSYPEMTEFLQSGMYKWEGDAREFEKDGAYIELVTSPNNPDGVLRRAVVQLNNNKGEERGSVVHDLAYYWPQYTAITSPANHHLMLFTVSKCTGHAGSRIGWGIVKNKEVAKKMTKFIEISSIGVSKESQLRAAKILGVVSDSCSNPQIQNFFQYTHTLLYQRWQKLRQVVKVSHLFTLQKYPIHYCRFAKDFTQTLPAFAWIMCKGREEDCEKLLRGHNILTRSGTKFGADPKFVRISMLGNEDDFNILLQRLSNLQQTVTAY
ncbi:PREDICTED: L-tryptophan--pyruvate aminotransferase 1-like [Ipomoea nil]|uniref:L-tryptophan--pyruvate aminotransferase 1-like n=1 Tax=Ipomoea nil TaxID=35883 RepID=UPI00090163F2|nr:PREDICTED: L-tryptophan--pyruvate aminotransferase 1-like [Ipomoea nil]